jgi:energy-coupling factor transporter transmembrane protein EcfT
VLPIQSAALLLKLFSFLLFIIELIFAIWEYLNNKKLKKYKIKGFQKKSEEERRHRYANLVGMYSLVSSLIFICILLLTLLTTPSRQCQDRAALEQAVCIYCEDQNCAVCDNDHDFCT